MKRRWSDPGHPLHLVLGLALWALWFVILYAGLSIVCTVAPPAADQGALTLVNSAVLAGGVAVAGALCWCARYVLRAAGTRARQPGEVPASVSVALYTVSAVASLAIALPGVLLPPCV